MAGPSDMHNARQARLVGIVLVGTMALWLGVQWVGASQNWPLRYAFLADLAALAGFFWALVVTYRIWRKRPK